MRGLIYNYRNYDWEFQDVGEYDLIALSLNFDTYPSDFRKFVTDVINDLYAHFPILKQKEVIFLAGNEVFEKRGSVEKVIQTTNDTHWGKVDAGVKGKVCFWNQKIRTSAEKVAVKKLLANQYDPKLFCFGYQSLETEPEIARQFIRLAQLEGYEVIDVELMTTSYRFSEIKTKFENNQLLGVDKVFIGCPYISEQLADYDDMFNKYALSIGDFKKDKFKLISYVQQFKTFTNDEQEQEVNKMLDDIIFGVIYKVGTKGIGVKRIQKIFNLWLETTDLQYEDEPNSGSGLLVEDGLYGQKTKNAIRFYQFANGLIEDGIAGSETLTSMLNFLLKRYDK